MKCAIVQNNIVIQVPIELDEQGVQEYASRYQVVIDVESLDPVPKVGWHYVNGQLIDPYSIAYNGAALLTRFAFFSRFTSSEMINLEGFMDAGPIPYRYVARYFKTSLLITTYVDRSWAFVQGGMDFLVQIGILTAARKEEIMKSPAKVSEIYRGD